MKITEVEIEELQALRLEIFRSGIHQRHVAAKLGMTEARLSRILAGKSPAPEGFKVECLDAIHIVQAAERAASEAFDRVMAGGAQGEAC